MKQDTAQNLWSRLDGKRQPMLQRIEGYANLTLPRLMEPLGADETNSTINRDNQSVGASGVNHLTNRVMLTMFAPSRPFIRLSMEGEARAELLQNGVPEEDIEEGLFEAEMKAVRELDNRPIRPKLNEIVASLIVTGNVLAHLPKEGEVMLYNLREYVVRRDRKGAWRELVVLRAHEFRNLDADIQDFLTAANQQRYQPESIVKLYTHVYKTGKRVFEKLYADAVLVDLDEYMGECSEDDCEWHPLVWNLRSGAHYGTGHVEDLSGDLQALSILAKAQVEAAILGSEFRWVIRPGAQTSAIEFQNSANGDAIPGEKDDIQLVYADVSTSLASTRQTAEDYIRRLGYAFLMNSSTTRDAERVTAEEIRQQAMELETSLGGVYSRLAGTLQLAVAKWLMRVAELDLKGTKIKLRIVTGLDALSRNGDLAALRGALQDVTALQNLGEAATGELNMNAIIKAIFMGWGVRPRAFLKTAEQKAAAQNQQMQQQAQASGLEAGARRIASQGPTPQ
jgi:hypothetical protein